MCIRDSNNVITSNGSGSLTVNAGMAGDIALISTQTASSSSTIDFTTGIDSTYGVYIFKWVGIVPATDGAYGQVVFGTAGPSWGITKITTTWSCGNSENDSNSGPAYQTDTDNTDNTNPAYLTREIGNYSGENANVDNEWTFVNRYTADEVAEISGEITHQRADNTRWQWTYNAGINHGTDIDTTGFLYKRTALGTVGTEVRYE